MMQKNEGSLLRSWYFYHRNFFDFYEIRIFDNDSDDPETLEVISEIRNCGTEVVFCPGKAAFNNKGKIFSSIIARHHRAPDWYFPLDCDEFLFIRRGNNPQLPYDLPSVLDKISQDVNFLRLNHSYWNMPHSTVGYYQKIQKVAVRAGTHIDLDVGFHCYDWGIGQSDLVAATEMVTDIGYLHFHNKPFDKLLEFSREKLIGRVDFNDPAWANYSGDGAHLIKYLNMSGEEYIASLNLYKNQEIDISPLFSKLNLIVPFSSP